MNIGIPKERRPLEFRVGLSPAAVNLLVGDGHACFVESGAGVGAGFQNQEYVQAGAQIVYSGEEVYGRADLITKVARPQQTELEWATEGQIVACFWHLAATRREKIETLQRKRMTAIAYEDIRLDDGTPPVLRPLSQLGGRMAAQIAAQLLQNDRGGKGILLGGVPGVPPAEVLIIGAGTVGLEAARAFLGLGAHVTLMNRSLGRLQAADSLFNGRLVTLVSHPFNVERVCRFADVVVGAVLVPGERTPIVVTREIVQSMKPRSVIIDISIDQGGCVATSRPTTHTDPTFVEAGVIHYCVPNMTGVVARTATHAFLNTAWPYLYAIAKRGLDAALADDAALRHGTAVRAGVLTAAH
jgi:alanine dehydrogenase